MGALTNITLAPMRTACSAMAYPILPLERFPIYRTGSILSCVPPAVTSIVVPSSSLVLHILDSSQSTIASGSGKRPTPVMPQANQPSAGSIIWYPKERNPSKLR